MSNKRILINSLYLYVRLIVTMFVGVFTSRFVLDALGVSDYGLYNVVGGVVGMMAFANTIMVTTTYRYLAYEQGKQNCNVSKIFNISLSIHLLLSMIVLIIALTIGLLYITNYLVLEEGKLSDAYFTFGFSVFSVICGVVSIPFRGLLVAKEKFSITALIEIFTKILIFGLVLLLIHLPGNQLRIYVVFITFAHALNPLLYVAYCIKNNKQTVRWKFSKDWKQYKEMLSFTGWNMIGVGASVGEHQGSSIIINRFFGTILNASFGVANQMNSILKMFASSLGQAIVPQITKSFSAGDHKRTSRLVILSSKYSFYLMLIPMLPILLETDFVLNTWLKEVPDYTKLFVQAMLLKSLISTSQFGINSLIHASGRIKCFKLTTSMALLLCLPMAYIAFRMGYPPYIISYIYLITAIINFTVTQAMLKIVVKYDIKEFLIKSTLKILLVSLTCLPLFLISIYMPYGLFRFLATTVVSTIVLLSSIFILGMEQSERVQMQLYFNQAKGKLKNLFV